MILFLDACERPTGIPPAPIPAIGMINNSLFGHQILMPEPSRFWKTISILLISMVSTHRQYAMIETHSLRYILWLLLALFTSQGSQYGSDDWLRFCRTNNLAPSMNKRGNCQDNAVAESFFSSLKKERISKRTYQTRIWPGRMSSITLKRSTTGPGATVTPAASVRRPSNRPRREDRICLQAWGQSTCCPWVSG